MSRHIIHIHGLGPKPSESTLAERERRFIGEGVGAEIPPAQFHLTYWADVMGYAEETPAKDECLEGANNFRPYSTPGALSFWVRGTVRQVVKDRLETHIRKFLEAPESGQEHSMNQVLDQLLAFVAADPTRIVYQRFLQDLHRYFFEGKREAVLERLRTQIAAVPSSEPICLIAHSMGSIIALDLLLRGTRRIEQFITIGSPLGLTVVQKQVGAIGTSSATRSREEMRVRIGAWTNFYDPLDAVALDSDLKDDFPEQGIQDVRVRNEFVTKTGDRNHHKSYGYVRTPEVGQTIREFLR